MRPQTPFLLACLQAFATCWLAGVGQERANALTIQIDYSHDSATENFFTSTPTALAALNAAAADLSALITTSLTAVTTDVFTGNNSGTTATFNWSLQYDNPSTGTAVTLNTFTQAADTITIFAGMDALPGNALGVGGPSSGGFTLSGSGVANRWIGAVATAESASNKHLTRGGGPIFGTLLGSSPFGAATANYSLSYGALKGALSLDNDTDNNGLTDSPAQLAAFWHFDHTTPVAAGKFDFYSVALHEIMHALGIGTSESWSDFLNATEWLGPSVRALNGGNGLGLIDPDGAHPTEGLMSPRLSDGVMQEIVMSPSLLAGTRTTLTLMDVAFLQDIGWDVIPEPISNILILSATLPLASRRVRRYTASA